jgi:type III pantothenate kinase
VVSWWRSDSESAKLILELDLGNTCAKWRIVTDRAEIAAQGVADIADWLAGQFPEVWRLDAERARIASVLAPSIENELVAKIQSELSLTVQLARSTANCCGVTNAYTNPERLGVDRWLALIAAYKSCGHAVMVVDAGTALTIDAVDDAGHHIGGYIIPGIRLMEHALSNGTDRVRYESGQAIASVTLGRDTRDCVQHGVVAALVGAIIVASEQFKAAVGKPPLIYITGGSSALLNECLQNISALDIRVEADLVLNGLRWVLP